MPRHRRRNSDDDDYHSYESDHSNSSRRSKSKDRKLNIGLKVLSFFSPRRDVRIVQEPTHRRQQERVEWVEPRRPSLSPSPPPLSRRAAMAPQTEGDGFVPLPPRLPRDPPPQHREPSRPQEYHPNYIAEIATPRTYRGPRIVEQRPFDEPPQMERVQVKEVRPSIKPRELERERLRRKKAEEELKREKKRRVSAEYVSDRNHDQAVDFQDRLDRVADHVRLNRAELSIRQRENQNLAHELRLEREERERQLERNNVAPPPLPPLPPQAQPRQRWAVDLFQEPEPSSSGMSAIRQAQADAAQRGEWRREGDQLRATQRARHADRGGRRGSMTIFDDPDGRWGDVRR